MPRIGRRVARALAVALATAVVVSALWAGANLAFDVQLPPPSIGRGAFPEPMDPDLPLREAFAALPAKGVEQARFRILNDNVEAWAERWRLLDGARERLVISYFILQNDVFGAAFLGHLVHKARQGVQIHVLLDAIGTNMSREFEGRDYLDALVNTKAVQVRMYRPLRYRLLDTFLTLNPLAYAVSEHDKILVADGEIAITGGRNIAREYFAPAADVPSAYRDVDILLEGTELPAALEDAFVTEFDSAEASVYEREIVNLKRSSDELLLAYAAMDAWLRGRPLPEPTVKGLADAELPWLEDLEAMSALRGALLHARAPELEAPARILDSHTRLVEIDDPVTRSLIRLLRSARREVVIHTPYVILLDGVVEVLEEVGTRGVPITIVTNSPASSDNAWSGAIMVEQWPELLARVPGLRLQVVDDERNLHAKVAVIDRTLVLVGTYNLDPLSMTMNSELIAALWSPEAAQRVLSGADASVHPRSAPVVEYRIARDAAGRPVRDADGHPAVVFGPRDHLQDDQWTSARLRLPVVRLVRAWRRHNVVF